MASIDWDIIEGAQATHHIVSGYAITRVVTVSGLAVPLVNPTTPYMLAAAEAALIAAGVDRGSPCPDIAVDTYLEQFIPEMVSRDVVKIRLIYRGYPLPTYELRGCLNQVESNLDADSHVISTEYHYPDSYILDGIPSKKAGKTIQQGGMVSRPAPEATYTVRWLVTAGTISGVSHTALEMMSWYEDQYMGTTNDAPYTIGLKVGAKHQWLINDVSGTSMDGGRSFQAHMSFQFRKATWDPFVCFINPDDGLPPKDLVAGTGFKTVRGPYESSFPTFVFSGN